MEEINIGIICPDIGIDFGRSKVIFNMIYYLCNNKPDYSLVLITNKESILTDYQNLKIKTKFIPISLSKRNFYNFFKSIFSLYRIIKINKLDIVHSHHRYSDLILSIVNVFGIVKTISTVHSFTMGYKYLSYRLEKIICVSYAVKKHLINEFHVSKEKLTVIYNGVTILNSSTLISESYKEKDKNFNIICIGRFDFEKGQDILLYSLERIWKSNNKIFLTLVGDFSKNIVKVKEKNKIEFKTKFKLLFSKNSKYIRKITSSQTPWKEIAKSDLVIIPSRIETFGLVAIEAGLMSKCVIASNVGGLKEIIHNGKNGILFESGNIEQLSNKILYLYNHRDQIKTLGINLHKDVEQRFTIESMMDDYIVEYKSLFRG